MLFFWRQPGFPSYSAARKRAGPHPAVAPKVALPVGGRLPFWRLRGSFVNPCRASWPFILFGMGRGSQLAAFTKVLITLNRCRFFLSWPAPPMEPAAGVDLPPKGRVRGGDLGSHRSAQGPWGRASPLQATAGKGAQKTKYTAELGFLVPVQLLHIAGNSLLQRLKGKGVGRSVCKPRHVCLGVVLIPLAQRQGHVDKLNVGLPIQGLK